MPAIRLTTFDNDITNITRYVDVKFFQTNDTSFGEPISAVDCPE